MPVLVETDRVFATLTLDNGDELTFLWLGLPPGERIKEVPLSEHLGVSRGPIREAIRLLEHDGLLKVIPNKGAVVPEPSVGDVLEVYAIRAALGSLALHKVMLESSALVAASLEKELTRFKDSVKRRKSSQAADADLSYQSALVAGADLPRVARQFEQADLAGSDLHLGQGDQL